MVRLEPLGDHAFLARFDSERAASSWAATVRGLGLGEVVLAYDSVAVIPNDEFQDLDSLEVTLLKIVATDVGDESGRTLLVPVHYDGPDLVGAGQQLELSTQELIDYHVGEIYRVFAIGFLPGFPYLGYLNPKIAGLRRLASPRPRVAAGSVAIAGRQAGIYPCDSPGGWHLIGRTPLAIVDVDADHFPISAGDRVQFVPIEIDEYHERLGERLT